MAYLRGLKLPALYLAALLCLFAADRAFAANYFYETQAQAKAACPTMTNPPNAAYNCTLFADTYAGGYTGDYILQHPNYSGGFGIFYFKTMPTCPQGQMNNHGTCVPDPNAGPTAAQCAARPTMFSAVQHHQGSLTCWEGCQMVATNDGSGGETALSPVVGGATCSGMNSFTCPTGYTALDTLQNPNGFLGRECVPTGGDLDGDGIPNGTDPTPFDAGEAAADSDGDGIPDSRDSAPNDPNNGKDTTGNESDNTSTGGGDCSTPPISKGDGILAQIAFQSWKTRCAAEAIKANTAAGGSAATGTATGSLSAADSQKLTDIKNNTALGAANAGAGAVNAAAIAGLLQGDGTGGQNPANAPGNEGAPASGAAAGHGGTTEYGAEGLNTTGYGASDSCPTIPMMNILGSSVAFDTSLFCTFAETCGLLVLTFAGIACLRILGGA